MPAHTAEHQAMTAVGEGASLEYIIVAATTVVLPMGKAHRVFKYISWGRMRRRFKLRR